VTSSFPSLSRDLVRIGRRFYERNWVLGTSGNFSAVVRRDPLRLAITASAMDKGDLRSDHILQVDETGELIAQHSRRAGRVPRKSGSSAARSPRARREPSAETLLHLEIVRRRGANAVLHTHSVWATMLSDVHASRGGLVLHGYEMLKGLRGVGTHDHREWIPIVENDQDMTRLARRVGEALDGDRGAHAILLQRHGLYTWGESLEDAVRHVEILEFLFETIGRTAAYGRQEVHDGTPQNP
jgi:methylthioribulose-1-phosphate dehydratase